MAAVDKSPKSAQVDYVATEARLMYIQVAGLRGMAAKQKAVKYARLAGAVRAIEEGERTEGQLLGLPDRLEVA